jgi:hypothetical protein
MKIKYSLVPKWCNSGLTNKEIDFLLHISQFQDGRGRIMGIYYRDVCDACDMCKQTFYKCLRSLKKKGIITYSRVNNDYDITILDNDFSYEGSYQEGYIKVSRKVFGDDHFKELRAGEKILLMLFMKVTHENAKSYQIGTKKFYEKYTKLLDVTKNVLLSYLRSLKSFFSIAIINGKYFITFRKKGFEIEKEVSETDKYLRHVVKSDCRRSKIKEIDDASMKDTIQLVKQYRKEAREQGGDILGIIGDCIYASVLEVKDKVLNAKYIHKLIRDRLQLNIAWN